MKRLSLLLGALTVVGSMSFAKEAVVAPVVVEETIQEVVVAPVMVEEKEEKSTLKLDTMTFKFVGDNRSGKSDGNLGSNSLRAYATFSYGENWTGSYQGRRYFGSNTKSSYGDKGLFRKGSNRNYFGVMRNNIFENYGLGMTYQNDNEKDVIYLNTTYKPFDFLSGYLDYGYVSQNGTTKTIEEKVVVSEESKSDAHYIEFQPRFTWNNWGASYYYEAQFDISNDAEYQLHQLRLFTPTVKYGNFSISGQWRTNIDRTEKLANGKDKYGLGKITDGKFAVHKPYIHLKYKLSDMTTVFTDLAYEFGDWKVAENKNRKSYNTSIEMGVQFKF